MNFKIHIYGGCHGGFPDNYMKNQISSFQGHLVYHDRVSQETALYAAAQADVLISIGNTTSNQCPSKVLDYISMCKPIIHIKKIKDCAASCYLRRYPLACIIDENEGISESNIEKIRSFLLNSKSANIEFNDVQRLFSDCTIKKVADILTAIMNDEDGTVYA